jgi:hypothetical protein
MYDTVSHHYWTGQLVSVPCWAPQARFSIGTRNRNYSALHKMCGTRLTLEKCPCTSGHLLLSFRAPSELSQPLDTYLSRAESFERAAKLPPK